ELFYRPDGHCRLDNVGACRQAHYVAGGPERAARCVTRSFSRASEEHDRRQTVEVGTRARDGAPSEERRGGRSSVPSTERNAERGDGGGAKLLRVEARRSGGAPPVEPSQDSRSGRPRDTRAGVPPRSRTAHQRARREDRTDSARARVAAV